MYGIFLNHTHEPFPSTEQTHPMKSINNALLLFCALFFSSSIFAGPDINKENFSALTVYKSPNCGCCGSWVDHMKTSGFTVSVIEKSDMNAIKDQYGIDPSHQSCHTALIDDYFLEGHIPVETVKRFLREKPATAQGLAVPGMPIGSPGMEMGERKDPYQILMIDKGGNNQVYEQR